MASSIAHTDSDGFSAEGSVDPTRSGNGAARRVVVGRQEGSEVVEVLNPSTNETYRSIHLASIMPVTTTTAITAPGQEPERHISMIRLAYEAGGFLAAQHLNQRNSSVVPDMEERLQGCDIQFTYEMADSQVNRLTAMRALQEMATRPNMQLGGTYLPDQWKPRPTAIIGGAASSVSLAMANLAGVYEIPQISGASSSSALDDKQAAPYFSRTFPTNQADSEALIIYFKSLGITDFGLIHGRDLYGSSYGEAIINAASQHGMHVSFAAFEVGDYDSLKDGLAYLKSTQVRYFFAVIYSDQSKAAFQEAYNLGIMGHPGYTWFLGDTGSFLTAPDFTVDQETESDIAKAIHGVGVLLPGVEMHPVLEEILGTDFKSNQQLQRDFVAGHQPNLQHYFDGLKFANTSMIPTIYVGMVYDAVITAGLAACQQSDRFFSSEELLKGIREQTFQGATGYVTFNNVTGTRELQGLRYAITNVIIAEGSQQLTPGRIGFESKTPTAIEFPSQVVDLGVGPYIYTDNTTTAPPPLPHLDVDMNLIPKGIQVFGWGLMAFIIILSLGCIAFAVSNRDKRAVAAAQPPFLIMIASGCLLMATAILPFSLQEPTNESVLDVACMSQLYLVCIGFCTSFSALFCKLYRINKILGEAQAFRRVAIDVRDVMYPLVIMVTLNFIVLVTWTIVDPLTWERTDSVQLRDSFNRPTSSYAVCSSSNRTSEQIFGSLLFAINFVALTLANWEGYKSRKLPDRFHESERIATSMFFLIEACLIGMPILLVVQGDPTGCFLVKAVLIFWLCGAILGPMFLPLWNDQTGRASTTRSVYNSKRIRDHALSSAGELPIFSQSSISKLKISGISNLSLG